MDALKNVWNFDVFLLQREGHFGGFGCRWGAITSSWGEIAPEPQKWIIVAFWIPDNKTQDVRGSRASSQQLRRAGTPALSLCLSLPSRCALGRDDGLFPLLSTADMVSASFSCSSFVRCRVRRGCGVLGPSTTRCVGARLWPPRSFWPCGCPIRIYTEIQLLGTWEFEWVWSGWGHAWSVEGVLRLLMSGALCISSSYVCHSEVGLLITMEVHSSSN